LQDDPLYSFGPYVLDATQRVLLRSTERLRLTPREIDVLIALVERHGEIVDKSRIFERVWKGVCVEECNLAQHVATLRRILGDDAQKPSYIETVPRRGYRFVAPVARASRSSIAAAALLPESATATPTPAAFTPPPTPPPGGSTPFPTPPPSASTPFPTPAPGGSTPFPTPTPSGFTPFPTPSPSAPTPVPTPLPSAAPPVSRTWLARRAPAALVVLAALGLGWWVIRSNARSPAGPTRSIAVLPFANLTGDAHQDPFAEALTSSLMSALDGVSGLRVEAADPRAADHPHRAEGVDALLETVLLRGEGRVRFAAELIDARTGRLIWAEVFDSDPVSSLEAVKQVAQAVATQSDADGQSRPSGGRAAAHREYALGREYLSRRTPQVVQEALEHLTAATALDASYALAQVGVAEAYLLGAKQRVLPPSEALAGAELAARRALELDPGLAEAHAALGEIAAARWDFEAAEVFYRRALGIDPAIASVHERYAALLTIQDRHEEAIAEARVARDLDPRCPAAGTALAAAYYHAGKNDAAIQQALAVLRLTPRFAAAYDVIGWAHLAEGRHPEAVAAFGEAVRLSNRSPPYVAALARAHARAGARDKARRLLSELERNARHRAASPLDLAEVLAAIGDTEKALQQVERAIVEGAPWLQHVDAGLSLAALHDRARFRAVVGRMHTASAPRAEGERSVAEAREAVPSSAAVAPVAGSTR
jgi:DNA-binding winged helix-turn-helix (wHTH) protein/TolB-like protein